MFLYRFFLILIAIISISLAGCNHKSYYQDVTGRYYYLGSNGTYYYQDTQGVYHAANDQSKSQTNSDLLAEKVTRALKTDPRTCNLCITVKSVNDQIILGGYVDNNEQRLRAIEIARSTPGVKLVISKILIKLL